VLTGTYAAAALVVIVVNPAFQRRGIGSLLTMDDVKRAHASFSW
jgi:ribosomal protein S18 acetylase RimI-like enzyme